MTRFFTMEAVTSLLWSHSFGQGCSKDISLMLSFFFYFRAGSVIFSYRCPFNGPSICLHLGYAFLNAKVCNNNSEISSLPRAHSTVTLSLARKSVYGSLGPCIVLTKEGWEWPVGTTRRHAHKKTWQTCCKSWSEY